MKRVFWLVFGLVLGGFSGAVADVLMTQGAGTTVFDFVCFATKHCPAAVVTNSAGTEIFTAAAPAQVSLANTGANATAVNAFITNANTNGQKVSAQSAPVVISSDQPGGCPNKFAFSQAASAVLFTPVNKAYICSIVLVSATQQSVSLIEGTVGICTAGTTAVIGGTAGTMALSANGGFTAVAAYPWLVTGVTGDSLCLIQTGAGNVSGVITYADHP